VTYGGLNAALNYTKTFRDVTFMAAGSASTRYSPNFADEVAPYYSLRMALTSADTRRWSWGLTTSIAYGQITAASLFAAGGLDARSIALGLPNSPVDYSISNDYTLTSNSTAYVGFGLSRRDRVTLGVNSGTFIVPEGDERQFFRVGGFVNYSRQLSRYLSLRAGYSHTENVPVGDTVGSPGELAGVSNLDLGFGYSRALPFSRETTIALNTGVSGTPRDDGWFYTAVGSAAVTHSLGRSWTAQVSAIRSLQFVPAFIEPTLRNAVSASIAGNLSRRLTTSLGANYSMGQSGFIGTPTDFDTYSGSLQFRYAVFDQAGLYAEYYYFASSFQSPVTGAFPEGEFGRHGVRLGVSFGTELLGGRR
jgi:hypothetical protein